MEGITKRILVVEDNEINLEILIDMLECMGYRAEGAEHGKEALDKIQKSQNEPFDAVLMDIHMPVMDGFEATKTIRQLLPPLGQIPVIALTGESLAEERRYAKEIGMNGFITKPATMEQIGEALGGIV
jgi:CheY-like chemotaxis protein